MAENFTTADDSDQDGGDFLAQSSSGNEKHFLIKVPDFGSSPFERKGDANNPNGYTENVTMSSFLRLGKFDFADETERSIELLSAIHQAGGPGDPRRPESSDWTLTQKTTTDSHGNEIPDPNDDNFGDWLSKAPPFLSRTPTAAGNNDVFFLDDVRTHDVDLDAQLVTRPNYAVRGHGLSQTQRQNESRQLYARGGWRAHSDGNRITTTYGDKIEVVRGNYKMIVLGRQDDPGEGMGWEATGDHVVDYAPGTMPGAGFWLEFVPDYVFTDSDKTKQTGVWLLVNTTEGVYEYARYAGNFREERWGDVLETYVGSENPPATSSIASDNVAGSKGHDPPHRFTDRKYDLPKYGPSNPVGTKTDRLVPEWQYDNKDVIRSNPHIIEKTWARRIDGWTGSAAQPVGLGATDGGIFEKTYATKVDSYTAAGTVDEESHVTTTNSKTYGDTVTEFTHLNKMQVSNTIVDIMIEETTTTPFHFEGHLGAVHLGMEVGIAIEIFLGGKFGFQAALGIEIATAGILEVKIPKEDKVALKKDLLALQETVTLVSSSTMALKEQTTALTKKQTFMSNNITSLNFQVKTIVAELGI
ncbi:MAG: hypothetical protein U0271_35835 [Polyangiaceae bacterium]